MDKTVGIVGLGIMGGAIARNLVERGWQVIGFDVDPAKNAELEHGADGICLCLAERAARRAFGGRARG